MDASNWEQLKELFEEACELGGEARQVFLDDLRRAQPDLCTELELLLANHEEAPGYFQYLAGAIAPGPNPGTLLTGQTVAHYEVLEMLGEGGMGVVYKARHLILEQPAALKFLSPLLSADEEAKERLIREARAAFALDHPNICTIYDIGETHSGQVYIAMAFYEGETLTEKIQRKALTLSQALDYASQICEGLAKAHASGVVHGDIKPGNVIVTHDGVVKLLDFGVADVAGVDTDRSPLRMGTVAYMSPERLRDGAVDHRTDIWSLGVVLYEMIAGEHPFQTNGDSTGSVIRAILGPASRSSVPEMRAIPPPVARIIERCLAQQPEERYQTVAALFADLRRIKQEAVTPKSADPGNVFVVYKHGADPDDRVAAEIRTALEVDREVRVATRPVVSIRWIEQHEADLEDSEFLIVFLSPQAAHSEMVAGQLELASRAAEKKTAPLTILAVRLRYREPLPYPLSRYLDDCTTFHWEDDSDTPRLIEELTDAMSIGNPPLATGTGRPSNLSAPLDGLGSDSKFYIERPSDAEAMQAIEEDGVTVTIKGPRQMGKTSLLVRLSRKAADSDPAVVFLDFHRFEHADMQDADQFFRRFCGWISDSVGLENQVESYWKPAVGNPHKCSRYLIRHVLPRVDGSLLLAMDEVERVFDAPFRLEFFSMLRSWHNNRAVDPQLRRLRLVLTTSTEPYELLKTPNLSPFNVGTVITLDDFSFEQVRLLSERRQASLSDRQIGELTDLLHGHPYLIQKALSLLATGGISFHELLETAAYDNGPFEDHLLYHLFRLNARNDLIDGLRTLLLGRQCEDEAVVWLLLGAGLVRRDGETVVPRCPLYAHYFRRRLLE